MNEASLQFHIDENDYFGTLATVLDLVSQDLRKKGHPRNAETLGRLRDRLMLCLAKILPSHEINSLRDFLTRAQARAVSPAFGEEGYPFPPVSFGAQPAQELTCCTSRSPS